MAPYLEQANKEGRHVFFIVEEQTNQHKIVDTGDSDVFGSFFIVGFFALFMYFIFWRGKSDSTGNQNEVAEEAPHSFAPPYLMYVGKKLNFSNEVLETVVAKYNPFFSSLNGMNKTRFIQRLQKFIAAKTFVIYDTHGYREMPILISATAIQITFGLEKYLLERFPVIAVHPEEYIKTDPLRVLMGNVQGNTITLSWKHFLTDYSHPTDGKNVGLHEMAHALQLQNMLPGKKTDHEFLEDFESYDRKGTDWLISEQLNANTMFDSYALRNKDEFWAASIELFFERPAELKSRYPQLYASICDVLNQDPLMLQMQWG